MRSRRGDASRFDCSALRRPVLVLPLAKSFATGVHRAHHVRRRA
jgi:hypothetical protein